MRLFFAIFLVCQSVYAGNYFSSPRNYPVRASLEEAEWLQELASRKGQLNHEEWGALQNATRRIPNFVEKGANEEVSDPRTIREVMRWMQVPPCNPASFRGQVQVVLS